MWDREVFHSLQNGCMVWHSETVFFPRVWPMSLWLGPYMSISSKNVICTKTQKVRKCRQITTNQKPHKPARRPANPPARFAFRQRRTANQTHKRGKSPNKNTHKEDLPRDTAVWPLRHAQKHAKMNYPPRHSVKHGNRNIVHAFVIFFFRPTPSWLSPGRLTRFMALQKQQFQISTRGRLLLRAAKENWWRTCT